MERNGIYLIRNADVYTPDHVGKQDVLLAGGRVVAMAEQLDVPANWSVQVVDASGHVLTPGLIDGHTHFAGAGGEGGPASRTPELQLSQFTRCGVTTAVGCLGADGYTRSIDGLLMKAKGLCAQGLSAFAYTGAYQVPTPTLTGKVAHDLCYVSELIGAGEIAIADHRSSSPTALELVKMAKECRVGGMLGGKGGILHLHMGDAEQPFSLIYEAVRTSELGFKQFYPTHVNRNTHIFNDAKEYARHGYVDITTGSYPYFPEVEIKPAKAVMALLEAGAPLDHLTLSSDAGGSLPEFDEQGALVRVEVGDCETLLGTLRDLVFAEKMPLADALTLVTSTPAAILKLGGKGRLAVGMDADVAIFNRDLQIRHLFAMGEPMIFDGMVQRHGTFEQSLGRQFGDV